MEHVSAEARLRLDSACPTKAALRIETFSTPCMCYPPPQSACGLNAPAFHHQVATRCSFRYDPRHIVSAGQKQTVLTPAMSFAEPFSLIARA